MHKVASAMQAMTVLSLLSKMPLDAQPAVVGDKTTVFVRGDKQSIATSYLSACISSKCTLGNPEIDVSSGAGLYPDYCLGIGYVLVPGTTTAQVTFPTVTAAESTPNNVATTTVYVATTVFVQSSKGARKRFDSDSFGAWTGLGRYYFDHFSNPISCHIEPQFETLLISQNL